MAHSTVIKAVRRFINASQIVMMRSILAQRVLRALHTGYATGAQLMNRPSICSPPVVRAVLHLPCLLLPLQSRGAHDRSTDTPRSPDLRNPAPAPCLYRLY